MTRMKQCGMPDERRTAQTPDIRVISNEITPLSAAEFLLEDMITEAAV
jgi:hypothetical protein